MTGPLKPLRFEGPERAIGRCFVPTSFGLTECLADVSEDYQRYRREAPNVWNDFAAWYAARETETSFVNKINNTKTFDTTAQVVVVYLSSFSLPLVVARQSVYELELAV